VVRFSEVWRLNVYLGATAQSGHNHGMMWRRFSLLTLLASACLIPAARTSDGFQCEQDAQCTEGFVCRGQTCVGAGTPLSEPAFPIRSAMYWGSFPGRWTAGTHFTPSLGSYDSTQDAVIQAHLRALQHGHIQVGFYSWYGPRSESDARLQQMLQASEEGSQQWAVYDEVDYNNPRSAEEVATVLQSLGQDLAKHPNYLRLGGKFVVMVHSDFYGDPCELSSRWVAGNRQAGSPAYLLLRTDTDGSTAYQSCAEQADAWFQFGTGGILREADSVSLRPGTWKSGATAGTLSRDPTRWRNDVSSAATMQVKFQIVAGFNNWDEGGAVESAQEWASDSGFGLYLDTLHELP
jgi:hypothetical protein